MTNFQTMMRRVASAAMWAVRTGQSAKATRLAGAAVFVAATLTLLPVLGAGCQNRAGMPCQQQSDCTPGLLCNKPPAVGAQGYGVCEPGLKGVGERCVSSAECSTGLLCSTDLGQPSEDGWHGACQPGTQADGGGLDLNAATDLGND